MTLSFIPKTRYFQKSIQHCWFSHVCKEKLVSGNIICERVSVRGVTRSLNLEELTVLDFPADHIGIINEAAAQRFLLGQSSWNKQFGSLTEKINAQRRKNMTLAKSELTKTLVSFHPS